jgi:predicted Zn-dependent peptidase
VIDGKVSANVSMQEADDAIEKIIEQFIADGITELELKKAINKTESLISFEDLSLLNRANNLSYYELLGDAKMMNSEMSKYETVSAEQVQNEAKRIFRKENSNTMWYVTKSR